MAIAFRELPVYIQFMIAAVVALGIIAAGLYAPGSPVKSIRDERDAAQRQARELEEEVRPLQQYEAQSAQFRAEMAALQKQLDILKQVVPEEKEVDEFIRLVQGAATSSNVEIRRMTAKQINTRDYHSEMPFEIEVDGPYFSVLDFFARLGRLSRIINVADLGFSGLAEAKGKKFPVRPGTTVTGNFTAVTFFTKGAEGPPAKEPGKQPGKR